MAEGNKKRVALVTGGTGGIGTAICERLYKEGYKVAANYKDFTKAIQWREEAKKWRENELRMGIDINIVEGDVADYSSTTNMIKEIEEEVGPIDILVNNAG